VAPVTVPSALLVAAACLVAFIVSVFFFWVPALYFQSPHVQRIIDTPMNPSMRLLFQLSLPRSGAGAV
jgi:hypothetical protein